MSSDAGRLAKNTTYLTVASILQKIISFGYFAFLADSISEGDLGKYTSVLALTSVFVIFMDFGLGPLLTREGSKDEKNLQQHVEKLFSVKVILIVLSLIGLFITIHTGERLFENIDMTDVQLTYIGAMIITIDTLTFTLFSIFRAMKQLLWEAIGVVIYQSVILAVGVTALLQGWPIHLVLAALLVGSLVQFVYLFSVLKWKTDITLKVDWKKHKGELVKILKVAAPFAIAGLIFRLNGSVDGWMLKILQGDAIAGLYGIAFKLTFALTVLPGSFATSYYPVVSEYYKNAKEKLAQTFEFGMFYMLLLAFPITAGVLILGDDIVLQVWDQAKEQSIMPLWIFMVAVPFIFLNYPVGNFLNAVNRQQVNTTNMMIALLVNIALNAWLIPTYSLNGAAIAALASSVVLVVLGLPWVYRVAPFNVGYLVKKAVLIGIAAFVMGFVLFFIQDSYHLILLIPVGAIIYTVTLFIVTAVTKSEFQEMKKAILKRG